MADIPISRGDRSGRRMVWRGLCGSALDLATLFMDILCTNRQIWPEDKGILPQSSPVVGLWNEEDMLEAGGILCHCCLCELCRQTKHPDAGSSSSLVLGGADADSNRRLTQILLLRWKGHTRVQGP